MTRHLAFPIALACLGSVVLGIAAAAPLGLIHIGAPSADPEKESIAMPVSAPPAAPRPALGPAGYVGTVTGDPEKDTWAHRILPAAGFASRR